MTVPLAQRDPVLRRFPLRRFRLDTAGGKISVIGPPGSDAIALRGSYGLATNGTMPYWADIWPASVAMARNILRGERLSGRALDLGCGLGVAGVAAGMHGAAVTFADRESDALAFARFNAEQNGVAEFDTQCHDWSKEAVEGPFELILLADVTYQSSAWQPLVRQLHHSLAPNGRALHADPGRDVSTGFLGHALRNGLVMETEFQETSVHGKRHRLRLATLRLAKPEDATSESP